jgi:hypothetical protein
MDFIIVIIIVSIAAVVIGIGWFKKARQFAAPPQEDSNPHNTCHGNCTGCCTVQKNHL